MNNEDDVNELVNDLITSCELINDEDKTNKNTKDEDIIMEVTSRKLILPKRILKEIAEYGGTKNYENLSKKRLEEINKLDPIEKQKETKFKKYKGDNLEIKGKDIRKSLKKKFEKKKSDILGKKRGIEKIRSKRDNKKISQIKDIVKVHY